MLRKFLILACLVILLSSADSAKVIENDKIDADQTEAGFLAMFNGKDLSGWDGDPVFWSVVNGVLIGQVKPEVSVKHHTYLIWQGGKVRDFELHVMSRSSVGNSGIEYRAERVHEDRDGQKMRWTIQGYQADIAKGWMGSLYNWGKPGAQPGQFVVVGGEEAAAKHVGSVAAREALLEIGYYKAGAWNEYTIIARGSHILHRINGYPTIEFIDNSGDARRDGVFGLQVHSGRGPQKHEFKGIRIKRFDADFGQAKLLFNGKDLSGWTFLSAEAKNAWRVVNGVLVNKGRPRGNALPYICTRDNYTNCVLRFQYRRVGKTKGAVLLRLAGPDQTQPKYIRISGKGDDFNEIGTENFALKVQKPRAAERFRRMPEEFWNECEIVLNKGQLEVKVNDVLRARAAGCEQTAGRIGFEAGDSAVECRNIVLIPILSDPLK